MMNVKTQTTTTKTTTRLQQNPTKYLPNGETPNKEVQQA